LLTFCVGHPDNIECLCDSRVGLVGSESVEHASESATPAAANLQPIVDVSPHARIEEIRLLEHHPGTSAGSQSLGTGLVPDVRSADGNLTRIGAVKQREQPQ
jgi:hypothetical protein